MYVHDYWHQDPHRVSRGASMETTINSGKRQLVGISLSHNTKPNLYIFFRKINSDIIPSIRNIVSTDNEALVIS